MKEAPELGSIVIIEHPYIFHRHTLARVVKVGRVMWTVQHRNRAGWGEPVRHKVSYWAPVPDGVDTSLMREVLERMANDLHSRMRALQQEYHAKVRALPQAPVA